MQQLTWADYVKLRDRYKGRTVSGKFLRLVGRYDPNAGTLERLNREVENYCRSPVGGLYLGRVYDEIYAIARTPRVEKYGMMLAELLILLPPRPNDALPARMQAAMSVVAPQLVPPAALRSELLKVFVEAQQDVAYRVFVEGPSGRKPRVAWKAGYLTSLSVAAKAWVEVLSEGLNTLADQNKGMTELRELALRSRQPEWLARAGQQALDGQPVTLGAPTPDVNHHDRRTALGKQSPGMALDAVSATPDVYELARAGPKGFSSKRGFSINDVEDGDLKSRLRLLGNNPRSLLDGPTVDYTMSAVGLAMSCLGVATGLASEVRAAIKFYAARSLRQTYAIVPFGNATSAVEGVRTLLNRHGRELAAMGAADIAGGTTSLAGLGPIGGVVSAGVKLLIRIGLALRDAAEVAQARELLVQGERWKDKRFVIQAMNDVPLLSAYLVMTASTSDFVGLLSDPHRFNEKTFMSEVEQVRPQLEPLRNSANECQIKSAWGIENLNGWMVCLDTRWYRQPQKEMYNAVQEMLRADTGGLARRAARLGLKGQHTLDNLQQP